MLLSSVVDIHLRVCRIVALFYNMAKRDTERAVQFLRPIIEERQRSAAELGEAWNDKPVSDRYHELQARRSLADNGTQNDLLQFILDKETSKNETVFTIAQRLLSINFAAIHT